MRIASKNEGIQIFVGSEGNRNERFFFALPCLFVDAKVERKVKRDGEKLVGAMERQNFSCIILSCYTSVPSCHFSFPFLPLSCFSLAISDIISIFGRKMIF